MLTSMDSASLPLLFLRIKDAGWPSQQRYQPKHFLVYWKYTRKQVSRAFSVFWLVQSWVAEEVTQRLVGSSWARPAKRLRLAELRQGNELPQGGDCLGLRLPLGSLGLIPGLQFRVPIWYKTSWRWAESNIFFLAFTPLRLWYFLAYFTSRFPLNP